MRFLKYIFLLLLPLLCISGAPESFRVAILKYKGGGDWYANPSSVPNLVKYFNQETGGLIGEEVPSVEVGSEELFSYPFVHMTGHGNVVFSPQEKANLRKYLTSGGFLHIDDNYGMDQFIRPILNELIPGVELVELPFSHPIFNQPYVFPAGLPKIHEHDNQPPQAFALLQKGDVVLLYTYESDLGDGWEDPGVHGDAAEVRKKALQMGVNILHYAFVGE